MASRKTRKSNKVLLVDDDPSILRLLNVWLVDEGFEIVQACDGLQALSAIETDCPDLIITDWNMPNMNGLEFCQKLRQMKLPHYVYTVFLTSRKESDDVIAALEAGADDILGKPIQRNELLARMRAGGRVLELERRLSYMANSDMLTGLSMRRRFYEQLEQEWSRSRRYNLPVSCVMFDIDFFKRINDSYGHPVGDACLVQLADLLTESCRKSDFVCRYAGDEFLALLPETNEENAAIWAERLRERIAATPVTVGDTTVRITSSFGIVQRYDEIEHPADLVDLADQALLQAKQSGRDCVICYGATRKSNSDAPSETVGAGPLLDEVIASDVMTPLDKTLFVDDLVSDAFEFFVESPTNSAAVVDTSGQLVGVLSEKDLTDIMLLPDAWKKSIRDVMRSNVVCYSEDAAALPIYDFLRRVSIGRVFVVQDDRPVGYVSRTSLIRWLRDQAGSWGNDKEFSTDRLRVTGETVGGAL